LYYLDNTYANLTNITSDNVYAKEGGIIYIADLSPVYLTQSRFVDSAAVDLGGVFTIKEPRIPVNSTSFNVSYVNITNSYSD